MNKKRIYTFLHSPWTIFIAMILGMVVGLFAPGFGNKQAFIGKLFIQLLRMGVVPLIFVNVIYAIIGLGDVKKLARIGGKTIVLFMVTTFCAGLLGCFMAKLIQPGVGFTYTESVEVSDVTGNTLSDFLLNMIPVNILQALSEGAMLQIVVFAICSGIAILYLSKEAQESLAKAFDYVSQWLRMILNGVLLMAPFGIFSLGCATMSAYGVDVLKPVAKLIITCYSGGLIQLLIVYPILYFIIARKNPLDVMKKLPPVWITAFSTRSTNATLPVSLSTSKEDIGVRENIADFVIPLGASINCDGASLFLGVVMTFVAQSVGMEITFGKLLSMALIGALVTLGNTGIPNSMFVMVPVVLQTFGLPMEFMGLMGVYPIIDSISTTNNVTGDNMCAAIIDQTELRAEKEAVGKIAS